MVTPSSPSCASISLANWFVHQEIYTTIYSITTLRATNETYAYLK